MQISHIELAEAYKDVLGSILIIEKDVSRNNHGGIKHKRNIQSEKFLVLNMSSEILQCLNNLHFILPTSQLNEQEIFP